MALSNPYIVPPNYHTTAGYTVALEEKLVEYDSLITQLKGKIRDLEDEIKRRSINKMLVGTPGMTGPPGEPGLSEGYLLTCPACGYIKIVHLSQSRLTHKCNGCEKSLLVLYDPSK